MLVYRKQPHSKINQAGTFMESIALWQSWLVTIVLAGGMASAMSLGIMSTLPLK